MKRLIKPLITTLIILSLATGFGRNTTRIVEKTNSTMLIPFEPVSAIVDTPLFSTNDPDIDILSDQLSNNKNSRIGKPGPKYKPVRNRAMRKKTATKVS